MKKGTASPHDGGPWNAFAGLTRTSSRFLAARQGDRGWPPATTRACSGSWPRRVRVIGGPTTKARRFGWADPRRGDACRGCSRCDSLHGGSDAYYRR